MNILVGASGAIGTYIYIFRDTSNYKYNPLEDNYTRVEDIPDSMKPSTIISAGVGNHYYVMCLENNIYLIWSNKLLKYNTLTNSYFEMSEVPSINALGGVIINSTIYIYTSSEAFKGIIDTNLNKTIFIKITDDKSITKLNEYITINLSNAQIYDDLELKNYPSYYGDGEKWNLMS